MQQTGHIVECCNRNFQRRQKIQFISNGKRLYRSNILPPECVHSISMHSRSWLKSGHSDDRRAMRDTSCSASFPLGWWRQIWIERWWRWTMRIIHAQVAADRCQLQIMCLCMGQNDCSAIAVGKSENSTFFMLVIIATRKAIFAMNTAFPPNSVRKWKPSGIIIEPSTAMPKIMDGNIWKRLRRRASPTSNGIGKSSCY